MTRQRTSRITCSLPAIVLVFLPFFACRGQDSTALVRASGQPHHLNADALRSLTTLHVEGGPNHLDWLERAPRLRRLSLRDVRDPELSKLPATLRQLKITNSTGVDLAELPPNLVWLSLSFSRVEHAASLARLQRLAYLEVEGRHPRSLPTLPETLSELSLNTSSIKLKDLSIPPSVQRINIEASLDRDDLIYFPVQLSSLSLVATNLPYLPRLPVGVRELSLINNRNMRIPQLPELLAKLEIIGGRPFSAELLPNHLQILKISADIPELKITDNWKCEDKKVYPRSIHHLKISFSKVDWNKVVCQFPNLKVLELDARSMTPDSLASMNSFPAHLRHIEVFGPQGAMPRFPLLETAVFYQLGTSSSLGTLLSSFGSDTKESLQRLELLQSSLDRQELERALGQFPNLRILSLSQSRLTQPGSHDDTTVSLDLRSLPITSLNLAGSNVSDLTETLPETLKSLDISYTGIEAVPSLPELTSLNVANSKMRDLGALASAEQLHKLTIDQGQLATLGSNFSKLRNLNVVRQE